MRERSEARKPPQTIEYVDDSCRQRVCYCHDESTAKLTGAFACSSCGCRYEPVSDHAPDAGEMIANAVTRTEEATRQAMMQAGSGGGYAAPVGVPVPPQPQEGEPRDEAQKFIELVAGLTMDRECTADGACAILPPHDGDDDEGCEPFDMSSDDAVETLHSLISKARSIMDRRAR